ncbi:MAG: hypothetical protein EPO55_03980 [Reyranella sp.]|nr:MAG: hypothetical protein EPO55_03980 [Reyranella sp.]
MSHRTSMEPCDGLAQQCFGRLLWLSGWFDDEVHAVNTMTGAVRAVRGGREPHSLTVWPQPGPYLLGHTGHLR